jgi:hypothetical protein
MDLLLIIGAGLSQAFEMITSTDYLLIGLGIVD